MEIPTPPTLYMGIDSYKRRLLYPCKPLNMTTKRDEIKRKKPDNFIIPK
jgi:hypothetical protein